MLKLMQELVGSPVRLMRTFAGISLSRISAGRPAPRQLVRLLGVLAALCQEAIYVQSLLWQISGYSRSQSEKVVASFLYVTLACLTLKSCAASAGMGARNAAGTQKG